MNLLLRQFHGSPIRIIEGPANYAGALALQMPERPKVLIDGATATPSFSGLSPQFVGVYQLTVVVPSGVTTGKAVPVPCATE